ncbi:APC family permease [Catenulispora rubra]|uniref:APC family permease n=1 Tax=Catenulispora rubra TaxID=280293 RepID=UPI00189240C3|nr:APC family permease [Catenulispora rubra]
MSNQPTRLNGNLGLLSVVAFGVAYMGLPVVIATFGVVASVSGGAAPTAYLVATAAMLLTGFSYAKMARVLPNSGSVYTYARKMLDSRVGFIAGWMMLLDYLFLPMVVWLIGGTYLNAQFPQLPVWAWIAITVAVTTAINSVGITVIDRVTKILLLMVIATLLVIAVLCVRYVSAGHGTGSPAHALWNHGTSVSAITSGAALAAFSFLGFDAVSTLSEEARDPQRTIPRGIVLTVLAGGTVFVVLSFLLQWVHPGGSFADESSAGYLLSVQIGGKTFADVTNVITLIGAMVSGGVAIQASTSRLMFVMGRDGVLPRAFFGRLSGKGRIPLFNVLLVGAIGLGGTAMTLSDATSFVNFGAIFGFTLVNVCVIAYAIRQRHSGLRHSSWSYLVLPAAAAAVDIYLLTKLDDSARNLGLAWLAIGLVYLGVLTGGFRRPAPEIGADEAQNGSDASSAPGLTEGVPTGP